MIDKWVECFAVAEGSYGMQVCIVRANIAIAQAALRLTTPGLAANAASLAILAARQWCVSQEMMDATIAEKTAMLAARASLKIINEQPPEGLAVLSAMWAAHSAWLISRQAPFREWVEATCQTFMAAARAGLPEEEIRSLVRTELTPESLPPSAEPTSSSIQ